MMTKEQSLIFTIPTSSGSTISQFSLDIAYNTVLENFTNNDVDELQKILAQIKSPQIRLLLERDLAIARSKLVTRIINDEVTAKSGKTRKKETRIVEEEIEVEIDDEDGYIENNIKGFKQKARGIKNTLPDLSYNKIKDALIRCQGDEGAALEALLSEELPPRPKDMTKIRVKKKIQKTETVYIEEGGDNNSDEKFVLDVTLEENETTENINERAKIIKKKIEQEKEKAQKLIKEIESYKKSNTDYNLLQKLIGDEDNGGDKRNRMYLPGEFDALEKDEPRLFTFKPERTFSNEVSHIHFRVAESEFYRLLPKDFLYKVTEVKYIVTPYIVREFEQARTQLALMLNKPYRDVKPILAFTDVKDNDIDLVVLNNLKDVWTNGAYFCNHSSYARDFITGDSGRLMFFLVLTGKPTTVERNSFAPNNKGQEEKLKNKIGSGTCLQAGDATLVFDVRYILPYYIVKYEKINCNYNQNRKIVRLDEEWKNIEIDAKADKFMNDVKEFYQRTLQNQNKSNNTQALIKEKVEPVTPLSAGIGSDVSFELESEELDDIDDVDEEIEDDEEDITD
jgi:hypothetical protein